MRQADASQSRAIRLSGEARREQILDAAKELVGESGMHAVSIESVARRAGITRPIVYSHFGDLPGLLEQLVDREANRALAQLAGVVPARLDPSNARQALLAGLRAYLDVARDDPLTWRLVLMPPEGAPGLLRERIEQGRAAVIAELAESIGPGLGRAGRSPDPELLAITLSTVADESVRLLLTDPERFPPERIMTLAEWLLEPLDEPPERAAELDPGA
ncbi:MAG: TetR/AcrR family transcriptional regulator [Solirubrobacterales bacterium]|nr:TetR/AcrR family transcriptional regulator [Solirubrobacterales bacterium]